MGTKPIEYYTTFKHHNIVGHLLLPRTKGQRATKLRVQTKSGEFFWYTDAPGLYCNVKTGVMGVRIDWVDENTQKHSIRHTLPKGWIETAGKRFAKEAALKVTSGWITKTTPAFWWFGPFTKTYGNGQTDKHITRLGEGADRGCIVWEREVTEPDGMRETYRLDIGDTLKKKYLFTTRTSGKEKVLEAVITTISSMDLVFRPDGYGGVNRLKKTVLILPGGNPAPEITAWRSMGANKVWAIDTNQAAVTAAMNAGADKAMYGDLHHINRWDSPTRSRYSIWHVINADFCCRATRISHFDGPVRRMAKSARWLAVWVSYGLDNVAEMRRALFNRMAAGDTAPLAIMKSTGCANTAARVYAIANAAFVHPVVSWTYLGIKSPMLTVLFRVDGNRDKLPEYKHMGRLQ